MFIVEWSKVHRLLNGGGSGEEETFQLQLYDIRSIPTYSGDGVIVFQYKDVENGANPDQMTEAVHVAAAMAAGINLVHGVQMLNVLEKQGA